MRFLEDPVSQRSTPVVLTRNTPLQLFEQLKNLIIRRRALRLTKGASIPPLTDLDFFLLGAVTKLFATSVTYPCGSFRLS